MPRRVPEEAEIRRLVGGGLALRRRFKGPERLAQIGVEPEQEEVLLVSEVGSGETSTAAPPTVTCPAPRSGSGSWLRRVRQRRVVDLGWRSRLALFVRAERRPS